MITPELISYIKIEREKGTADLAIRSNLINNGWSEKDIEEAFISLSSASGAPLAPTYTKEFKKYRNNVKWVIFTLYMFLGLFWIFALISGQENDLFSGFGLFTTVATIGVIYASAYIAASGATPLENRWKEIGNLLIMFVAAGVLILALGFGVFFISCIFLTTTGGFKSF